LKLEKVLRKTIMMIRGNGKNVYVEQVERVSGFVDRYQVGKILV